MKLRISMTFGPHILGMGLLLTLFQSELYAANLALAVLNGGMNSVEVGAGETVDYEIVAVLSDAQNEGLAGVLIDLSFSGGPLLLQVEAGDALGSFVIPEGLTNPSGFGGTLVDGDLLQIGGVQNTVNNPGPVPTYPTGDVVTGIAQSSTVIATGSLQAPDLPGVYALEIVHAAAAVIVEDDDGVPFWQTETAPTNILNGLNIVVAGGLAVARPLVDDDMGFDPAVACNDSSDCPNASICSPSADGQGQGTCYVPKNRFVSMDPNPANAGLQTARRVSLETGDAPVVLGWVGQPNGDAHSLVAAAPYYADWTQEAGGGTVHLGDCHIGPGHTYLIQAIEVGADTGDESAYSEALSLPTVGTWGDVIGPAASPPQGVANFEDVFGVVQGFQNVNTVPKWWLDLSEEQPNVIINFADILLAVQAFQTIEFPYPDPCSCANLGPCP